MALGARLRAIAAAACLAAAAAAQATQPPQEPQEPRRPNVLLILVDDLNTRLGAYGDERARTPAIDALAARGVRFERAYCQYPLCNPSRISLFSGLRPQRTGVFELEGDLRDALPDTLTLPELLRRSGWSTARIGKVHHRNAPDDDPRSWDLTVPIAGREEERSDELTNLTPRIRRIWGVSYLETDAADEELVDGRTAAAAIEYLEAEREQPFFLAVGFLRPHVPFVAPARFWREHPLEQIEPAPRLADDLADVPSLSVTQDTPDLGMDAGAVRKALQGYAASTSFVDSQIGRVLAALERLDLARDTYVVLTSDHGFLLGEHGQWMKWSLFEPAARVPLIVAGPGIAPGVSPRTVELLDLYPTLAGLCGLAAPAHLEGASLAPLLAEPGRAWERPAFTQLVRLDFHGWSVRTERWRYTEWDGGAVGRELYDHASDPGEHVNLAEDPEHAATAAELAARIAAEREKP
jgi:iduronate 2-sulfatase